MLNRLFVLLNVAFIMFQPTQRRLGVQEIEPIITRQWTWAKHTDITQDNPWTLRTTNREFIRMETI